MTDTTPIPPRLWRRIIEFLRDGRTGRLTLVVDDGKVQDLEILERFRGEVIDS